MRTSLGAVRFNGLEDRIVQRVDQIVKVLEEKLMADGYPPFHEPLTPRQRYETLNALREANSDMFWNDPEAIKEFEKLLARYGPPPAVSSLIPPMPNTTNPLTPY